MEITCDFLRDYLPSENSPESVVINHIRNCMECQEQSIVLRGSRTPWSAALT